MENREMKIGLKYILKFIDQNQMICINFATNIVLVFSQFKNLGSIFEVISFQRPQA